MVQNVSRETNIVGKQKKIVWQNKKEKKNKYNVSQNVSQKEKKLRVRVEGIEPPAYCV